MISEHVVRRFDAGIMPGLLRLPIRVKRKNLRPASDQSLAAAVAPTPTS
jgi:hypothetical protein